jgi:hypothetical protein
MKSGNMMTWLLLLTVLLLPACGTFEVGIECTATPGHAAPPTTTVTTAESAPQTTQTTQMWTTTDPSYPANDHSGSPVISADGRWIAFQSLADNLVAGDANGYMDVFIYDRETGKIELVSWAVEP